MDMVSTKQIRNICLLGHGSAGKTSVAEAMRIIADHQLHDDGGDEASQTANL